jgi:hypothetical protein
MCHERSNKSMRPKSRALRRAGFDRLAAKLLASSLDITAEGPSCDRRTVASDKAARPPKS